ncbi:vacuolar protein-sorting protein BRO1 [Suhomyces tanzawaensis NRRL Y-17324]|uniref:BRO domain-containing protein 1 n=1 Tax=Suhomyces tanzawaensis NRRL Y-17324 TaxID=984487 RepID=A0A1E4SPT9_9ASCO|nr:vacuolar protein-sorting protein BRO1 [Suhomyces tanzawaensis NRRL Y-17324]ODV81530.1 vacuolar protein-sorting protein BRO1 [Suhomyces tanzawaensis NRRL Y-17324]
MKTYLLQVPAKKTEEVNWVKPLNNYLLSVYGNTSEYQEDLASLDKLRQDLRGASPNKTGIKLYCKYYSQIELLDLRVPFSSVNKHKKISFEWHDVFQADVTHKQHALPFEKANILFNLGAILSGYAVTRYDEAQKSSSAEGSTNPDELVTESIKVLLQTAGVFQFIQENFLHAPSYDLSQPTIRFLVKLMLAQAQEIFVMKVISGDLEQKKNSLISKLCRSTASHYEECFKMIRELDTDVGSVSTTDEERESDSPDDIWENPTSADYVEEGPQSQLDSNLDESWIAIIHFKLIYYKSLAYYFNGLNFEAGRKYGQALAYLTKSSDILNELPSETLKIIGKKIGGDAYELLDNYKYQKDAVAIKLGDLNKDNDLIYHDIIPSLVTLPDIKPMDSTKIIPMNEIDLFQEINEHNYSHFLTNVVPINIHELLSYYSEEKSQFLRNELDMVDVSNEELASVLEYLKLPKALATLKELLGNEDLGSDPSASDDIDPNLKRIADEVGSKYSADVGNRNQITYTRKQIYDNITEGESILASAQGAVDSERLAKCKDDMIKIKKALYDATNSDGRLFGLVNDSNSQLYQILGKGSASSEFRQLFEVKNGPVSENKLVEEISLLDIDDFKPTKPQGGISKQIKRVEDILHDLNVIRSNKNKLIEALKKEIHEDDISDILILNSRIKSSSEIKQAIFPEEMKKFEVYNNELDKLIERQKTFIKDLGIEWDQLSQNGEVKEIQKSKKFRTQLIEDQQQKIERFYNDIWQQYSTGLSRGVEFYKQLLNYSEGLKQRIISESRREPQRQPQAPFYGQDYRGAPSLPPKRPSQSQPAGGFYSQTPVTPSATGSPSVSNMSRNPSISGGPPQFHQPGQVNPQAQGAGSAPGSDLIYNNPSTYQPNMYNFFSNN